MSGLFDSLASPAERSEQVLRKALEARREAFFCQHGDSFYYRGAGDLLLQHGSFYTGRELPQQYAALKGSPNQCFANALEACKADSTLRYVEGVYTTGYGHPTPHAWCLDPAGDLLELTLPTDAETIAILRNSDTGLPFPAVDRWAYWGAVFHPEYVEAIWEGQEGHVGILDRPTHDGFDKFSSAEWRDDWPVLRQPYDQNRRTP